MRRDRIKKCSKLEQTNRSLNFKVFRLNTNQKDIYQEVRLNINEDHTSWEDDSTGPKGENTEEAEVISMNFKLIKIYEI